MINRHILFDGVRGKGCVTAIHTANRDLGHDSLTIRNVTRQDFRDDDQWRPVHVRNTRSVLTDNVRIGGRSGNLRG